MIDYTLGFWVMDPVLNKTSIKMVVYRTAETAYESGRMERLNSLKPVSPQKFRLNALDYIMMNKTAYLNIL